MKLFLEFFNTVGAIFCCYKYKVVDATKYKASNDLYLHRKNASISPPEPYKTKSKVNSPGCLSHCVVSPSASLIDSPVAGDTQKEITSWLDPNWPNWPN